MEGRKVFQLSGEEAEKIGGMLPRGYALVTPHNLKLHQQAKQKVTRSTSRKKTTEKTPVKKSKSAKKKAKKTEWHSGSEEEEVEQTAMEVEVRPQNSLEQTGSDHEMEV